jgi:4-amino-4-deoxy-L-arabinose transferase-like glycosyltransferase
MATSQSIAQTRAFPISYRHLAAALLCGFALRLLFISRFPFYAGDTKFYEELAQNWLYHGVYGLFIRGDLTAVDQRVPGYPAFLAVIYSIFGRKRIAVMLAQAVIDLATCVFAALIAARIAPEGKKQIAATIALWIAVLCPFTASYTAAILTETLAAFFTTLALLVLVWALTNARFEQPPDRTPRGSLGDRSRASLDRITTRLMMVSFLLAGFVAGLGTLVRPETPLVLAAAGIVICVLWRRRADWWTAALASLWMAVGLLAALTPWAARNARTMGRVEFLAPHYAESAGDYIPRGFYAWTRTWMVRYGDAYRVTWALGKKPIEMNALPAAAFDSDAERERVTALLASYNSDLDMTPALDGRFEELARERAAAHPLRTFVLIPTKRAFAIWFSPRVDVLQYSGKLRSPAEDHHANAAEFDVTLLFWILDFVYIGLALAGAWRYRNNPGCALIIAYLVIRTALFTQLPTIEPRYVVVCFAAIAALGALAFVKSNRDPSSPGRESFVAADVARIRRAYATKR